MIDRKCIQCGAPITRHSKTGHCVHCGREVALQTRKQRKREALNRLDPREEVYGHPTTLRYWDQHMDRKLHRDFDLESPLLDVGCGTGEKAFLWAVDGWEVSGFDISTWCIAKAAKHKREESHLIKGSVDYTQADIVDHWPYADNAFMSLVCTDVLEHIIGYDSQHFFSEVWRVVVPGGRVLIVVPHGKAYWEERHIRTFEANQVWVIGSRKLRDHHVEVRDDRLYLVGTVP